MNYYWFNRQKMLQKAKKRYSKEKAAEYYKQNKEATKEKSREPYKNLSQEENKRISYFFPLRCFLSLLNLCRTDKSCVDEF